jgi:glycosyltransferase involved in cell wall biosynthesis
MLVGMVIEGSEVGSMTRVIVGERRRDSSEAGGALPRVSFVVPAHDEEALLPRTLGALRLAGAAARVPFEIVVADDASTDRTAAIAAENGARVVRLDARRIASARNAGARAARGALLVFVDADTVVPPATLAAALRAIDSGAVGGGAPVAFDGRVPLWARIMTAILNPLFRLLRASGGCFVFARRDVFFERTPGWDESLLVSEELSMCRELRRAGRFAVLREKVVTSGRKLRTHSAREILGALVSIGLRGRRGANDRRFAALWYGDRRADPGERLDEPAAR